MQKNSEPIGIFDSGIGGLTVFAELVKNLPHENIIYFGDTAHVPYGSKSREKVTEFSKNIVKFLCSQNVKIIVVACNTASAFALNALRESFKIPVTGVIEPGSKAAVEATLNNRIGVIGTAGTVRSDSYKDAINRLNPNVNVFSKACPLFVPLVEEGWLEHEVTAMVTREYLEPLLKENIDTLVLGCTHYPLIKKVIQKTAGNSIKLIDSAESTSLIVKDMLSKMDLLNNSDEEGSYKFYVSDVPEKFKEIGCNFLRRPITPVEKVNLD